MGNYQMSMCPLCYVCFGFFFSSLCLHLITSISPWFVKLIFFSQISLNVSNETEHVDHTYPQGVFVI